MLTRGRWQQAPSPGEETSAARHLAFRDGVFGILPRTGLVGGGPRYLRGLRQLSRSCSCAAQGRCTRKDLAGQGWGATDSLTCAPGGRPSCWAASPALTAREISPALSVNATISPGATAAKVSRYGIVSWRRPQRTISGEPNPTPRRPICAAGIDSCTLPNRSTDMTSPSAWPSYTRLVGAGSVTSSATAI